MDDAFLQEMAGGYAFDEPAVVFGGAMLGDEVDTATRIRLPLSMVNRHGLVAGATGTGKTKTLQLMAGQLSDLGVPVFVADVKGDLTGVSQPGSADAPHVPDRCASLGWTFEGHGHPVELLSLSGELGARVRATVHSFGPILLAKVLDLNKTQTSVLSMVFKYCDDQSLPLLDLDDLRTTLRFLGSDEGKPVLEEYGGMSPSTVGVLLRSLVDLEQQGAADFFGEPEFDVADLLRVTPDGEGVISLLELSDVMDRPRLFSTFMLWMLAQVYAELPEEGDLPKPKLAFFFDEAHLLFDDASDALMDQIELTARLIRSKGVGVYFVTQAPTDVPVERAVAARQPDPARAPRLHARGRDEPEEDRSHDAEDRSLRRGRGADLARDRRGVRHGALAEGRAHTARRDAPDPARLADGRGRRGDPAAAARGRRARGEVRAGRRPRERPRDHQRATRHREGVGGDPRVAVGRRAAAAPTLGCHRAARRPPRRPRRSRSRGPPGGPRPPRRRPSRPPAIR